MSPRKNKSASICDSVLERTDQDRVVARVREFIDRWDESPTPEEVAGEFTKDKIFARASKLAESWGVPPGEWTREQRIELVDFIAREIMLGRGAEDLACENFADWSSEASVKTAHKNKMASSEKKAASARAKAGKLTNKTKFLKWAIDDTFEDFPEWWRENGGRPKTWRMTQIIARLAGNQALLKDLPESLTVDVELSGDDLLIGGKVVTVDQIKSIIPHLVEES